MSRIHEALKKAEQERAAIVTAETEMAPLQAESATATATATATAEPVRNAEGLPQSGTSEPNSVTHNRIRSISTV